MIHSFDDSDILGKYHEHVTSGVSAMQFEAQVSAVREAMNDLAEPTGMSKDFQRETVARLTTYCERLIRSGALPPENELQLRTFVNLTCTAFDMAPVQESIDV